MKVYLTDRLSIKYLVLYVAEVLGYQHFLTEDMVTRELNKVKDTDIALMVSKVRELFAS